MDNTETKVLVIVGSSKKWFEDFITADALLLEPYDICCVNKAILCIPCVTLEWPKYWYSYHDKIFKEIQKQYAIPVQLHSCQPYGDIVLDLSQHDRSGSSGLQAVKFALRYWKYDKIILCGIGLDKPYYDLFYKAWARSKKEILNKVKVMSGNLVKLLGTPDKGWINEPSN